MMELVVQANDAGAAFIAALVRQGVTFKATMEFDVIVVKFTGGF